MMRQLPCNAATAVAADIATGAAAAGGGGTSPFSSLQLGHHRRF